MWDDFQGDNIYCPKCQEQINVRQALRDNVETRQAGETRRSCCCPKCGGAVSRRWFIKCPHCGRWLFGPMGVSRGWFFVAAVAMVYLAFTWYYITAVVVH